MDGARAVEEKVERDFGWKVLTEMKDSFCLVSTSIPLKREHRQYSLLYNWNCNNWNFNSRPIAYCKAGTLTV